MRLARVRTTEGTVGVAVLADDGSAQLLDLSGSESVNSLADLPHSADPVAVVVVVSRTEVCNSILKGSLRSQ